MPKVSVIMPTYNRAHTIRRSVKSVLNQTYKDFELIIIDDASTDSTREEVLKIQDNRIKSIALSINGGPAHARSEGIRQAKGELITFNDSDDEWFPSKLEKEIELFNKNNQNIDIAYSIAIRMKGNRYELIPPSSVISHNGSLYHALLRGNFIAIPILARKECFETVGLFDESFSGLEDWDLFIRLAKKYDFFCTDAVGTLIYDTSSSISKQSVNQTLAYEKIFHKYYDDIKKDPLLEADYLFRLGKYFCLINNMRKGREYVKRAAKKAKVRKYEIVKHVSSFGYIVTKIFFLISGYIEYRRLERHNGPDQLKAQYE